MSLERVLRFGLSKSLVPCGAAKPPMCLETFESLATVRLAEHSNIPGRPRGLSAWPSSPVALVHHKSPNYENHWQSIFDYVFTFLFVFIFQHSQICQIKDEGNAWLSLRCWMLFMYCVLLVIPEACISPCRSAAQAVSMQCRIRMRDPRDQPQLWIWLRGREPQQVNGCNHVAIGVGRSFPPATYVPPDVSNYWHTAQQCVAFAILCGHFLFKQ